MPEDKPTPPKPVGITAEQAGKVLAGDLANMVKKVANGQTLNNSERGILEGLSRKKGAAGEGAGGTPAFAKNQSQLAVILDVARKTIQRYSKRPDAPAPRPNGSLSVAEWKTYLQAHEVLDADDDIDAGREKAKQILLQNQKLEFQLAVMRDEYVPVEQVQADVAEMIATAKMALLSGPASLAPQVVGETVVAAEKILRDWIYGVLSRLHADPLNRGESHE